jgi:hypothetical protein
MLTICAGQYILQDGGYAAAPDIPSIWDSGFPRTGMSVITALSPNIVNKVESLDIVVFGGQQAGFNCPATQSIANSTLASRESYRITVFWTGEQSCYCLLFY